MGNDGGTIAKGKDFGAVYERDRRDVEAEKPEFWRCSISGGAIKVPGASVVADSRGHVYAKEALLRELLRQKQAKGTAELPKGTEPPARTKLPLLKHTTELHFTLENDQVTCPVTSVQFHPLAWFGFPSVCGCVLSWKCLRQLEPASGSCPRCGAPFTPHTKITVLNPLNDPTIASHNKKRMSTEKPEKPAKRTKV